MNAVTFTLHGKDYSLTELAKEYGLSYSALHSRLNKGWNLKKALETPIKMLRKPPTEENSKKASSIKSLKDILNLDEGNTVFNQTQVSRIQPSVIEKGNCLIPLSLGGMYKFKIRRDYNYKLERIVKCAEGPLALFRISGCKALESFTTAQLMDEGYKF